MPFAIVTKSGMTSKSRIPIVVARCVEAGLNFVGDAEAAVIASDLVCSLDSFEPVRRATDS